MQELYDEISARFPEVHIEEYDIDSPYSMMREIIDWLQSKHTCIYGGDIIKRVVQFKDWCENQERGESAKDDIFTIYTVAFLEKLFEHPKTQELIPYLISRKELIENREYMEHWAGKENYNNVLKMKFPKKDILQKRLLKKSKS